jgi:hypothetical protein
MELQNLQACVVKHGATKTSKPTEFCGMKLKTPGSTQKRNVGVSSLGVKATTAKQPARSGSSVVDMTIENDS